jgi:hypothetical protein
MLVLGLVDALHRAAGVARTGATEIKVAQTRVLSTVQTAGRAGFDIDDDLSVWDSFPEAPPLPTEPPPPQIPLPPYQPKVWAACKARGADPNKVVRTFNRAPLSVGFRSLPGGDSKLYCGNEKFGFLHLEARRHQNEWSYYVFSWIGNWRNLADYAIGVASGLPRIGNVSARRSGAGFPL